MRIACTINSMYATEKCGTYNRQSRQQTAEARRNLFSLTHRIYVVSVADKMILSVTTTRAGIARQVENAPKSSRQQLGRMHSPAPVSSSGIFLKATVCRFKVRERKAYARTVGSSHHSADHQIARNKSVH